MNEDLIRSEIALLDATYAALEPPETIKEVIIEKVADSIVTGIGSSFYVSCNLKIEE